MKKVLVIDEFPQEVLAFFEERFQFDYRPRITADEVIDLIPAYEGLLLRSKMKLEHAFFEKARKLEFIGRSGAGIENVDLEIAEGRGIKVFNSPEGNCNAVAEHALSMILSLLNKIPQGNRAVREGVWDRIENRGSEIQDKVLGIIGYGNMGECFSKKARHLFKEVLVYDKYKSGFSEERITEVELNELYQSADIVSLHTNLTEETNQMVNAEFLSQFQKKVYLINTSRGQVVDTAALMDAIDQNIVSGACLDVLEFESLRFEALSLDELPEAFKRLSSSGKVILSPHVAGWTHESNIRMPQMLLEKIQTWYSER